MIIATITLRGSSKRWKLLCNTTKENQALRDARIWVIAEGWNADDYEYSFRPFVLPRHGWRKAIEL